MAVSVRKGRVEGQLLTSDHSLELCYPEPRVANVPPLAIEVDLQPTRRKGVRGNSFLKKTEFSVGLSCECKRGENISVATQSLHSETIFLTIAGPDEEEQKNDQPSRLHLALAFDFISFQLL